MHAPPLYSFLSFGLSFSGNHYFRVGKFCCVIGPPQGEIFDTRSKNGLDEWFWNQCWVGRVVLESWLRL